MVPGRAADEAACERKGNAMVTATAAHLRELDRRMTGGVEVTLLWNRLENAVIVSMSDTAHRMQLQFGVEPSTARDAFNHPYPYATAKGLRPEEIFFGAPPTTTQLEVLP
jgi:hypothetical protein